MLLMFHPLGYRIHVRWLWSLSSYDFPHLLLALFNRGNIHGIEIHHLHQFHSHRIQAPFEASIGHMIQGVTGLYFIISNLPEYHPELFSIPFDFVLQYR